jgi:hypothetical protein
VKRCDISLTLLSSLHPQKTTMERVHDYGRTQYSFGTLFSLPSTPAFLDRFCDYFLCLSVISGFTQADLSCPGRFAACGGCRHISCPGGSCGLRIFFVYSFGARFAAAILEYGHMLLCIRCMPNSENQHVGRERLHHRSIPALDAYRRPASMRISLLSTV